MLQLAMIRNNKEAVLAGLKKKNFPEPAIIDLVISMDDQRKALQLQSDELLAQRNAVSKSINK